jgi:SAM-dependent methyltransferase
MPFDPLPTILADLCEKPPARRARAVELGCGDGQLLAILRARGLVCMGLDRLPRSAGSAADLVGDALRPPLRPASLDLVIAANLVRHLWPAAPKAPFLAGWLELLRPGGSLLIMEDEPVSAPPPAARYRDLQAFLARVAPGSRGPLLAADSFRRGLPAALAARVVAFGEGDNAWPQDATAAVAMLRRGRPEPGGEADRLATAIAADGLACGRQWWCQLRAEGREGRDGA